MAPLSLAVRGRVFLSAEQNPRDEFCLGDFLLTPKENRNLTQFIKMSFCVRVNVLAELDSGVASRR